MKTTRTIALLLALATLAVLGVAAARRASVRADRGGRPAAPASSPRAGPVRGIVAARPFALEEGYLHHWRAEQPEVRAGWLVVLDVDPEALAPSQLATPVLLVGDQTAERVNFGGESGRLVAIVPAEAGADGGPATDLAASAAWFAEAELPERVDADWIASERARASRETLAPFADGELAAARAKGGAPLRLSDRVALEREAALLVIEHSPQEQELADGLLVPVK